MILALWTEQPASFQGEFYRLDKVEENPAPVQKPHPPIMIGGSGEKVTLRLVAQYAQFCNVGGDAETVGRRSASCASTASGSAGRTTRSRSRSTRW